MHCYRRMPAQVPLTSLVMNGLPVIHMAFIHSFAHAITREKQKEMGRNSGCVSLHGYYLCTICKHNNVVAMSSAVPNEFFYRGCGRRRRRRRCCCCCVVVVVVVVVVVLPIFKKISCVFL